VVRWHYQWIVLHEFPPLSVGNDLLAGIWDYGPAEIRCSCLTVPHLSLSQCVEEKSHLIVRIQWKSIEEHLQWFPEGTWSIVERREPAVSFIVAKAKQRPEVTSECFAHVRGCLETRFNKPKNHRRRT
jgi:hypothetical protein